MKRHLTIGLYMLAISGLTLPAQAQIDPLVEEMVAAVSQTRITEYVQGTFLNLKLYRQIFIFFCICRCGVNHSRVFKSLVFVIVNNELLVFLELIGAESPFSEKRLLFQL